MQVGIESINVYAGPAVMDVQELFCARELDLKRFDNLMMRKKSVGLPCEDSVTYGVNAAKPIIDQLNESEKSQIKMVITGSESGIDFGKSISTYIHDYLGLHRACRLFEVKQACYAGTAALQMAACFLLSGASPGAKVLVVATDVARAAVKHTYAEPSQAVGAVAMLVSTDPKIIEFDFGATGQHSYEVMDTCRPLPDIETGDPDLSLLSYLDCLEYSYRDYANKVENSDFLNTFDFLAFHTPFAGMVKGAHRTLVRRITKLDPDAIENDFQRRVTPSLSYCVQVGNIYSATLYLALCSLIDHAQIDGLKRVGLFSYGSGCSSEFYSGVVSRESQLTLRRMEIQQNLEKRYPLSIEEYENVLNQNMKWLFGVRDQTVDFDGFKPIYEYFFQGKNRLVLKCVREYHREYDWS